MIKKLSLSTVVSLFISTALMPAGICSASELLRLEMTVDPFGRKGSIAIDTRGVPAVAYLGGSFNHYVKYARLENGSWVGYAPGGSTDVFAVSLRFSDDDIPYIALDDAAWGQVWVAYPEDGKWQRELVDEHYSYGMTLRSIAFDSSNNPHVVYCGQDGYYSYNFTAPAYVRHAWSDGESWQVENVSDMADDSSRPSLVIGPDDSVHIAWIYQDSLMYAFHDRSGTWGVETVDGPGRGFMVKTGGEIALNGATPCICYGKRRSSGFRALFVARREDASWKLESVAGDLDAGPGDTAYACSIAADSENTHVAYRTVQGDDSHTVRYAVRSHEGWRDFHAAPAGAESFISLALDNCGSPHAAFLGTDLELEYASLLANGDACSVFSSTAGPAAGYELAVPCVRVMEAGNRLSSQCWSVSLSYDHDGLFSVRGIDGPCLKPASDPDAVFYPDGRLVVPRTVAGQDVYSVQLQFDFNSSRLSVVADSLRKVGKKSLLCE